MKQKLFFAFLWLWIFTLSLYGCTATQKQAALCYSGCVLASIPACVQRCEKSGDQRLISVRPETTLQKAKRLYSEERKADSKNKK